MIDWKAGDVAIAIQDRECGCGRHSIRKRATYRVQSVQQVKAWVTPTNPAIYLDVCPTDEHYYPQECFRKEQPANTDLFKLAKAPKVLEPQP